MNIYQNMFFVFESNESGIHNKGNAEFAFKYRGAKYGINFGLNGRSFAITTKNHNDDSLSLLEVKKNVNNFIDFARKNPQMIFQIMNKEESFITNEDYSLLFNDAPQNCIFPKEWLKYLNLSKKRVIIYADPKFENYEILKTKIDNLFVNIKQDLEIVHNGSNILISKYIKDNKYKEVLLPIEKETYKTQNYSMLMNIKDLTWYGTHLILFLGFNHIFENKLIEISEKENIIIRKIKT